VGSTLGVAGIVKWIAIASIGVAGIAGAVRVAWTPEAKRPAPAVASFAGTRWPSAPEPAENATPMSAPAPMVPSPAEVKDHPRPPASPKKTTPAAASRMGLAAPAPPAHAKAQDSQNPPSTPASTLLREETSTLDVARTALRGGRPADALSALDAYAQRFPRGMLGPEATVLRIESLLALGDRVGARRLAEPFLRAHGPSPLAKRVRDHFPELSGAE
jgi:hypothetical protein